MGRHSILWLIFWLISAALSRCETIDNTAFQKTNAIQQLFNLAIVWPARAHLIATVKICEQPWSQEQIDEQLRMENEVMKGRDAIATAKHSPPESITTIRSNVIARSHSGTNVLRLQEWDFGDYYRLDETKEADLIGIASKYTNNNVFHDTVVELHDPAFSPYQSFTVNYGTGDIQLSRDPGRRYARYNLWRVVGIDESATSPIILTLPDPASMASRKPGTSLDKSSWKIDYVRLARILEGKERFWRIEVTNEVIGGRTLTRIEMSVNVDIAAAHTHYNATYWLSEEAGRFTCAKAAVTNIDKNSVFVSERSNIDSNGYPRLWRTYEFANGELTRSMEANFTVIDFPASFDEVAVFAPESFTRNTNAIVADIGLGSARVLRSPLAGTKQVGVSDLSSRRKTVVKYCFVSFTLLTLSLGAWLAYRQRRV